MGIIFDEPAWQVRGIQYNGEERLRTFHGPNAFNDATNFFDQMKAKKRMWELWLVRLNGTDCDFREGMRRNSDGQWVNIPSGALAELPPGMRPKE